MTPVWTRGFAANPAALSVAVVELATGGHCVGKYLPTGRHQTLRFFPGKGSGDTAHAYAELWNGPEAHAAMYPERAAARRAVELDARADLVELVRWHEQADEFSHGC